LPSLYAQAGIFVLPTLADEWGLVVNEAMAAGLPVLGSAYSQAVEELVEDCLTGWTFRPGQAGEMYKALDRALRTPHEKLEEMRRSARRQVENLTPQFVADLVLQAIQYVCSTTAVNEDSSPRPCTPL
jgi:glycosyltransferase involved in cell wall biosynthesis